MATRMLQRRGTAAEWSAANPVLAAGEMGFETDTFVVKMGDGVTAWNDLGLPYVHTSGATMTGDLTLPGDPTQAGHAARKSYVDTKLPKAGGTMTGALSLIAPAADDHAARRVDVDTKIATAKSGMWEKIGENNFYSLSASGYVGWTPGDYTHYRMLVNGTSTTAGQLRLRTNNDSSVVYRSMYRTVYADGTSSTGQYTSDNLGYLGHVHGAADWSICLDFWNSHSVNTGYWVGRATGFSQYGSGVTMSNTIDNGIRYVGAAGPLEGIQVIAPPGGGVNITGRIVVMGLRA